MKTFYLLSAIWFADASAQQVFFSPNGGAEKAIVRNIDSARRSVAVMIYTFTSDPIADALLRARRRGVQVSVIADGGQVKAQGSDALRLRDSGIAVTLDKRHKIFHNKVIVIDSVIVITGSFNFTKAAERDNAENVLIQKGRWLAKQYLADAARHLKH